MPKQCAFLYADAYTRGQMSPREVQDTRALELQQAAGTTWDRSARTT